MHPIDFFRVFVTNVELHGHTNSGIDRAVFLIWLIAMIPMIRRNPLDLAYCLPLTIVPAVAENMMSFTRYALAVFPVFLLGGRIFAEPARRRWLWPILAFDFAIQMLPLIRYTYSYWAE